MGRAKLRWDRANAVLFERVKPAGSRLVSMRNHPSSNYIEYVVEGESVPDGCDEVELKIDGATEGFSSIYVPVIPATAVASPHQTARTVLEQQIANLEELVAEHEGMAAEFERKANMSRISAGTAKLDIQELRETLTLLEPATGS